jgi:hypothetical protein
MNARPTPKTDALRDLYENYEYRATVGDIWELCEFFERERDEAREESIRWMSIAEGRGRTDDEIENDTQCELAAWELLREAQAENIGWQNKWQVAVEMAALAQNELAAVTAQRDEAREAAEHYRNLYYLPKDGLEAAKNHPLSWENAKAQEELATVTAQRDGIDSMYHKIIKEVLECDPISACKREDDHLEPPWEVIARIRKQRDRLAEALQDLIESCNCIDSVDFMPVSMPEAFEKAQQALQSLTPKP